MNSLEFCMGDTGPFNRMKMTVLVDPINQTFHFKLNLLRKSWLKWITSDLDFLLSKFTTLAR